MTKSKDLSFKVFRILDMCPQTWGPENMNRLSWTRVCWSNTTGLVQSWSGPRFIFFLSDPVLGPGPNRGPESIGFGLYIPYHDGIRIYICKSCLNATEKLYARFFIKIIKPQWLAKFHVITCGNMLETMLETCMLETKDNNSEFVSLEIFIRIFMVPWTRKCKIEFWFKPS